MGHPVTPDGTQQELVQRQKSGSRSTEMEGKWMPYSPLDSHIKVMRVAIRNFEAT